MADVEKKFRNKETGEVVAGTVDGSLSPAEQYDAVMAQQKPKSATAPEPPQTFQGALANIATSAGLGAGIAAASPELLMVGGRALMAAPNPYAKGAGLAAFGVGENMRSQRALLAIDGFISGITSETAGQIADQAGASKPVGFGTRVAVGALTPGLTMLRTMIGGPVKALWNGYHKLLGDAEQKSVALAHAQANLKNTPTNIPQQDLHVGLLEAKKAELAAAQKAADKIIAEGNANAAKVFATDREAANRLAKEAEEKAANIIKVAKDRADAMTIASKGATETAAKVAATSDHLRSTIIAPERELTDIGEELRQGIQSTHKIEYDTRQANYKVLREARDKVVEQNVKAGREIADEPGLQALSAELDQAALLTAKGAKNAKGRAEVTDPGTKRAYQQLHDSITPFKRKIGTDAEGNDRFETVKPTWKAIDTARRRLGDVIHHNAQGAEGYAALGEKFAKEMYERLGLIQENYAGESQRILQQTYHEGSESIRAVSGKLSRKATAVDKINPDEFELDAKELPGRYFKSAQKVEDLTQLIGEGPTKKLGEEYLSRTLAGHDAKYVEKFLASKDNTDWMRQVPELQDKGYQYLKELKAVEQRVQAENARAVALAKGGDTVRKTAVKEVDALHDNLQAETARRAKDAENLADKTTKMSAQKAKDTIATTEKKVANLAKTGWHVEDVNHFLKSASTDEFDLAVKHIARTPGGMKALEGSMRKMAGEMTPETLNKTWNERLSVMAKRALPEKDFAKLEKDVQAVMKTQDPKKAYTSVQRLIAKAMGTAGGTGSAYIERKARNKINQMLDDSQDDD